MTQLTDTPAGHQLQEQQSGRQFRSREEIRPSERHRAARGHDERMRRNRIRPHRRRHRDIPARNPEEHPVRIRAPLPLDEFALPAPTTIEVGVPRESAARP